MTMAATKKRRSPRKALPPLPEPPPGSIGADLLKSVPPVPPPTPEELHTDVPASFRLLGKQWKVLLKTLEEYGTCEAAKLRIELGNTQPVGHLRDTFLHETVHAIDIETQLNMSEKQVRVLSTVLLAWMRENPTVVGWLMKEQH
jgi:hypothetical protein